MIGVERSNPLWATAFPGLGALNKRRDSRLRASKLFRMCAFMHSFLFLNMDIMWLDAWLLALTSPQWYEAVTWNWEPNKPFPPLFCFLSGWFDHSNRRETRTHYVACLITDLKGFITYSAYICVYMYMLTILSLLCLLYFYVPHYIKALDSFVQLTNILCFIYEKFCFCYILHMFYAFSFIFFPFIFRSHLHRVIFD